MGPRAAYDEWGPYDGLVSEAVYRLGRMSSTAWTPATRCATRASRPDRPRTGRPHRHRRHREL